jgi:general secretion pathway protein D
MTAGGSRRAGLAVAVVAAALLTPACASKWAHRQGQEEMRRGNWDLAVARFTRALEKDPDNIGYKIALENARIQASRFHYDLARKHLAAADLDKAAEELGIASKYDPSNKSAADDLTIVRDRMARREQERTRLGSFEELRARAAARSPLPVLSPRSPVPITLKWDNQSRQKLYETLGKLAGVNVIFDEGFQDKPITVNLTGVTFQEALDQISLVTRNFYKVLDQNTVIIIPEQTAKRRAYDDILLRTFYIQNAELKEMEAIVKTTLGPQARVASNPTLSALTVLGTVDELGLADRVIELNDKARGEVVVEVEILEVNRERLKQYGIELSNYQVSATLAPTGAPNELSQGFTNVRAHLLSSLNLSDFVVSIPSTLLSRFLQTDTTVKLLASPRLRASEGKKTTLKIIEKVPVPQAQINFNPQQGGVGAFPTTTIAYQDVGVTLELTPRVNASGEIALELAAEFSLQGSDRNVGTEGNPLLVPIFSTRNVNGILRVHDGETSLIGGLVQGRESHNLGGLLGVQDIPILNRVFSGREKRTTNSEIVISITPRLVRAPKVTEGDLIPLSIGTRELTRVQSVRSPMFGEDLAPLPSPSPAPSPGGRVADPAGVVIRPPAPGPGVAPTPIPPPVSTPLSSPTPSPFQTPPGTPLVAPPSPSPEVPAEGVPVPGVSPSPPSVSAPGQVLASVSPSQVSLRAGENGSMGIVLVGGRDLTGLDLLITFDPAVVDATDLTAGPLLMLDGAAVGIERAIEPGRVRARLSRGSPVTGSGVVASLSFRGLRPGTSPVRVEAMSVTTAAGPATAGLGPAGQIVVTP